MANDSNAADTPDAAALRAAMLDRLERSWADLASARAGLDEGQLTAAGPDGWSVKDHLAHLAHWELYLLAVLEGRDGRAELGLAEGERGEEQAINAGLQRRDADLPLADVQTLLEDAHTRVTASLQALDGTVLTSQRQRIEGNTSGHYEEHAAWIRSLARTSG
jgi:hypothetical protein